ncbi:MAG: T9SS type A sorting domain-containing protein [Crocinitomicaceae bacterium]|nr:T9SS type A sorting domain-containing protein [Crocinitomicaceae bacterium]
MKSLLLFASALFVGSMSFGQITVTDANLVNPFEMVKQAHDTVPTTTIGSAGAAQTWDYSSSVVEHFVDTLNFATPGTMPPGSAYYPGANLGAYEDINDNAFMYLKKDVTGLYMLGQVYWDGSAWEKKDAAETIITFPSTMGTSFTESSTTVLGTFLAGVDPDAGGPHGFVDSVKYVQFTDVLSVVDAWGDITTPLGIFASIRQNKTTDKTDSLYQLVAGVWEPLSPEMETMIGQPGVQVYSGYSVTWWSDDPSARFPVMEMSHDNAGTVYSVTWLNEAPSAGLHIVDADEVNVYPNPATNALTIELSNDNVTEVVVYSITGAVVSSVDVSSTKILIELTSFENGVYFYELRNAGGEVMLSDRFIVQK